MRIPGGAQIKRKARPKNKTREKGVMSGSSIISTHQPWETDLSIFEVELQVFNWLTGTGVTVFLGAGSNGDLNETGLIQGKWTQLLTL